MKIQVGYEMVYNFPRATPMILMLNVHGSRRADIEVPDDLTTDPPVPIREYCDSFGNRCTRIVAPGGRGKRLRRTRNREYVG